MIDTQSLRNKIIDLAVTGKLTQSLEADVDFHNILPSLYFDNKIEKTIGSIELPSKWCWVNLGNLGENKNAFADGPFGSDLKKEHYTDKEEVRIIQLSNVGYLTWKDKNKKFTTFEHLKTISRSEVVPGNIVISKMMPAGRAIIVPELKTKFVLSSDNVKFVPNNILNTKYLFYAINSTIFSSQIDTHGIGRERTSLSKLKTYVLPLPPLEEQQRIVEKVESIFAILDEIDKNQKEYANNANILKTKLLDLAMQGKLTVQISSEHVELDNDIDTEGLPNNWKYAHINEIANSISSKSYQILESEILKDGDYPVISQAKEFSVGYSNNESKLFRIEKPIVLFGDHTTIVKFIDFDFVIGADGTKLFTAKDRLLNIKYFYYLLTLFADNLEKNDGYTRHFRYIKDKLFPIPPLAEQQRIVEKLDQLLPLCEV